MKLGAAVRCAEVSLERSSAKSLFEEVAGERPTEHEKATVRSLPKREWGGLRRAAN